MKKPVRYTLVALIIVALVVAALALHRQRQHQLAVMEPPQLSPWAVDTTVVATGRATQGFPALALVKGENNVAVAPRLEGIILEMGPREGERVDQGMVLARIDTRELDDKLASLQAQLAGARADAQRKARDAARTAELLQDKSISESQADQTQSAARSAQEQVNSLEKQIAAERTRLGYAQIAAPFTGVISERLADPGDLAAVGKPLYRIVATSGGRIEVRLPASVLEQVKPGNEVVLEHHGQIVSLEAARVFPSLDERSLGRMEIDVDELPFNVAPGGLISARVITRAINKALLAPADAVLSSADDSQAWVYRLSTDQPPVVTRIPVRIRMRAAEGVALEGDLQPGDRLIVAHETLLRRLQDGDTVRIERQAQ